MSDTVLQSTDPAVNCTELEADEHLDSQKHKSSTSLHIDDMRLRQVLILTRDLSRSTQFFQEGLGLKLLRSSESFAEFDIQAGVPLCIKLAQKCVFVLTRARIACWSMTVSGMLGPS